MSSERNPILRQMLRDSPATGPVGPVAPDRALRLALTRAVETALGIDLVTHPPAITPVRIDDMPARAAGEWLLVALCDATGRATGLIACDYALLSAVIELRTTGRLFDRAAPERSATATDAALVRPLLDGFLAGMGIELGGTALEGWLAGAITGRTLQSPRHLPLELPDRDYTLVRFDADLPVAGRGGALLVLWPTLKVEDPVLPDTGPDWAATMAANVMSSVVEVDAVLHREKIAFPAISGWQVGDTLVLPGAALSQVRLEAEGKLVATGRVGVLAGGRALRIEDNRPADMAELPLVRRAAIPPLE